MERYRMNPKVVFSTKNAAILNDDTLNTSLIRRESIDLIVTSPPYNLDVKYLSYNDSVPYDDYLEFSKKWLTQAFNWLKSDGRLCLNIPLDKNKGGIQSVGADMTAVAKEIGFKYHTTIIWNKGDIPRSTARGSWQSASCPYVITPVELILVFYKDSWKKRSGSGVSNITREEFISWTDGLWTFGGESKRKIGHPAPFPCELPKRCIKLFSFVGDKVLDPFMGSGSTIIAAKQNDRYGIGIEANTEYCDLAAKRIQNET